MVAVSLSQVKKNAGASCPKFHKASCQLQNISNFQIKIMSDIMQFSIVKMTLRHKKHIEMS